MKHLLGTVLVLLVLLASSARGELPVVRPGCDCDGHTLSGPCNCNRRLDDDAARQLLYYVVRLVVHVGGEALRLDPLPQVRMSGPDGLRLDGGDVALGTTWEGEIRLGSWMRRPEALLVLAHEYGHVWQDCHHPRADDLSERFSEGFASWVADVVARQTGYQRLAGDLRKRSGPVYQEGLAAFRRWEGTVGVPRLLELARTWVDFAGEGPATPTANPPKGALDRD